MTVNVYYLTSKQIIMAIIIFIFFHRRKLTEKVDAIRDHSFDIAVRKTVYKCSYHAIIIWQCIQGKKMFCPSVKG